MFYCYCRLRKIAHSATENEFHVHVQNLKASIHWKESTLLQKWFEGKWLKNAKVHLAPTNIIIYIIFIQCRVYMIIIVTSKLKCRYMI